MHRPTRQLKHLLDKLAEKEARSPRARGKRAKRWKKFAAQYTPLSQDTTTTPAS